MTKKLAADWAPHGIRVNAVAAGFFPHEASVSGSREEGVEPLQNMIPAGRTGSIWEFGWLSAMTCTALFGAMTGQVIVQDGGESRTEEHTSELQSLMRISYAVFCQETNTHENTMLRHSKQQNRHKQIKN